MMKEHRSQRDRTLPDRRLLGAGILSLGLLGACSDGDDGRQGPPGPPGGSGGATSTELTQGEEPPGIHIAVLGLRGATGPGGNFAVGDTLRVDFTIEKDDGSDWDITEMSRGRILVSGPSFNYQRVIPEATDLHTASVQNADGSYTYTFASPIPATYLPPLNDSPAFGTGDGELTGQPLLGGTYTVGLYTRWDFTVDGEGANAADNETVDFLLGGAVAIQPREVVTQENCNRCHSDLRAHGGQRKDVTICLMCHTSGSEDGETPGESVDFRVMIHKIHNAKHLPSVLGVGTNPDGSRNYAATPKPYLLGGTDFSHIGFPVFPNLNIAMPRDVGYVPSTPEAALEDQIRTGATSCDVCHGDPDGAGPLPAPAQGGLAHSQPTRRACGACHDDIDWTLPYTANEGTMPPQLDDATCVVCHDPTGDPLSVVDGHLHPLLNPDVNPGLVFDIQDVVEAPGASNGDGSVDPGEKVQVTLALTDDLGMPFDPLGLASNTLTVAGPTSNYNLLLNTTLPKEVLVGPQPYVFNLPQRLLWEFLGDSAGGTGGEVFATAFSPHWNGATSLTTVYTSTTAGGGSNLAADAAAFDNFIDVDSGLGFLPGGMIVIDDGTPGLEEYLRVQHVDGNRLWFGSAAQSDYQPGLRHDHASGAPVEVATLVTLVAGVDYTLDALTGQITETPEFGSVSVLASYTSDFVLPAQYPLTLNSSPDLDESSGKWTGKGLAPGTYSLNMWGNRSLSVTVGTGAPIATTYSGTSSPAQFDFLVAGASALEPYDLISSPQNCYDCHEDLYFHGGGRRGFETCLACHGAAGTEDRPQYRAWGAPATTGVQIGFREMLHKIHMGVELFNASSYTVVGFGPGGPPNNYSTHSYEEVGFPAMPDGVQNCDTCHGSGNSAWTEPAPRDHPTEQTLPVRSWALVCSSCHDSPAAMAHIGTQTFLGVEACATCHDTGSEWDVETMHKAY